MRLDSALPVVSSARQNAPNRLSIRELPRAERPRERLKAHGAHALSSAELLAIIVGTGAGGQSALGLAHEMLAWAGGSLRRIAGQPVASLTKLAGVGSARAVAGRSAAIADANASLRAPRPAFVSPSLRTMLSPIELAKPMPRGI